MGYLQLDDYVTIINSNDIIQTRHAVINDILLKRDYSPILVSEKLLLKANFIKHDSLILDSYNINISKNPLIYKIISITIEQGNQYIYIREGELNKPRHEDIVISLFNSDLDGDLYIHKIQRLYNVLTNKNLSFK